MSILLYERRFIIHSCDYCKAIVCIDDDSRVINLFMLNFVILKNMIGELRTRKLVMILFLSDGGREREDNNRELLF